MRQSNKYHCCSLLYSHQKFERYSTEIVQISEDLEFLFGIFGEQSACAIEGYNINTAEIQNDENKFDEFDLMRFNDNKIVEPNLAIISFKDLAKNSALILSTIQLESKLEYLMRVTRPGNMTKIISELMPYC